MASGIGIWIYDLETFDKIALLTEHKEEVSTVAFSRDGAKLVSASGFHSSGTLKIWDAETAQNIAAFQVKREPVNFVEFAPDGLAMC